MVMPVPRAFTKLVRFKVRALRLINLLGVKQIAIGCNKMDCDTAGYSSVATMCPSSTSDHLSYVGLRDPHTDNDTMKSATR